MNDLNEQSEEALFNYEEWIKNIKRKYKYGKQKNYEIGDKVGYFIHMYKASTNRLHAYELECLVINNKYNNYDIKTNEDEKLVYLGISYKNLRNII
tara:strand:+ start:218 stop:505 length:288 start_codon:yes stop_codon:yes gene_type:complete